MPLEKFQMRLLSSLPFGDRLEGIDVPPDQFRERRCTVLRSVQGARLLELHFPMLRPAHRGSPQREGLVFLIDYRLPLSNADDRRISAGAVGLLACADRCHGGLGGVTLFMTPI